MNWKQTGRNSELLFHHLPPEFSVSLESSVHNAVQTFDEAVQVLHLLCHVLVVLQRHLVLPKCAKETSGEKGEATRHYRTAVSLQFFTTVEHTSQPPRGSPDVPAG